MTKRDPLLNVMIDALAAYCKTADGLNLQATVQAEWVYCHKHPDGFQQAVPLHEALAWAARMADKLWSALDDSRN
jgi:hypothetical protein